LFQDLEGFRLDDYKQFDDGGKGMERLQRFVQEGVRTANGTVSCQSPTIYEATLENSLVRFTIDRKRAKEDESLTLLGMEHPLVRRLMQLQRSFPASQRGLITRVRGFADLRGVLSLWHVQVHGGKGQYHQQIVTIGLNEVGERSRQVERLGADLRDLELAREALLRPDQRLEWVRSLIPEMIRRELTHNGHLVNGASLTARLLAWVELV
jgi:hypothetical protein